ncbi:DUF2188 domain-containing protein [Paracoccus laeviglucosivorans]|uniref:DUF2188 domain-containing protein n=1 Tax=Paracoccus laeviglucosivorans TaxID=1197861 RepID=A0A521FUT3_9RHOB|nr:DUF2188 domain-containing protein [Paracoccus laeviglucosivorans]SMO99927.1 hypothetical protein SAMN06265221_1525 [Paracoccus laeviglucosivorans]
MTRITYEIVQHDNGWAYKVDDVFSETFETKAAAVAAAQDAAARQELSGENETIQFQDEDGKWHVEDVEGSDRPDVEVDENPKA